MGKIWFCFKPYQTTTNELTIKTKINIYPYVKVISLKLVTFFIQLSIITSTIKTHYEKITTYFNYPF